MRTLTDQPIVRYLGRDPVEETARGGSPGAELVADWLRGGGQP
jgi:hypothetical protein